MEERSNATTLRWMEVRANASACVSVQRLRARVFELLARSRQLTSSVRDMRQRVREQGRVFALDV